jgi:lipoate-protein ligase B
MPIPTPLPEGVELAETERGGDLTAHMPGQLVVYPIFKLDGATTFCGRNDVDGFLRSLEQVVIDELAEEGLSAERRPLATGVWIDGRKIASIGIAVRRNVTYHGLALNLVNDLGLFRLISPCGFSSEVMTRLEDLRPKGLGSWRPHWEWRIAQRFERLSTPTGQFRVPDLVVYSESNSTRGTG